MTLTDFLLERIAEDEAVARMDRWPKSQRAIHHLTLADDGGVVAFAGRVMAECEAKRRIVDEHHPNDPCDAHDSSFRTIDCDTLRLLALPYADHPDYREEWKP